MQKVRYFLFQFYWVPLLFLLLGGEFYLFYTDQDIEKHVALLGSILPIFYFVQKQKLDELHVFLEIFESANDKYKKLGNKLEAIVSKANDEPLDESEREVLIAYFNLCAEEYLYFRQGYIFPHVWDSWENAMRLIFSNPRVSALWESESKTHSYYGFVVRPGKIAKKQFMGR